MPGNGNSRVNYQQRKSLKKTSSNEQYKLQNQGGSQAAYHQGVAGAGTRGNSVNSSQNEPIKYSSHHQQPLTQNYISRPTSGSASHGGGVIQ